MAYLYGLIIVGLFFGVMHFFTELNLSQKLQASLLVVVIISGAIFYNHLQQERAAHLRQILLDFEQGKEVRCQGYSVNNKTFTLSIGTQTFIAKKESKNVGVMLAASECE